MDFIRIRKFAEWSTLFANGIWAYSPGDLGSTKRLESFTNSRGSRLQTVYSRLQTTFTAFANDAILYVSLYVVKLVCKIVCVVGGQS